MPVADIRDRYGPPDGRMARGLYLLRRSWGFLRDRPRLLVLPFVSAALVTAAVLLIAVPTLIFVRGRGDDAWIALALLTAVAAVPVTALATFFNVAFLSMVVDATNGIEPSVDRGLAVARSRLRAILAWSLLATIVGLLIGALNQIPSVGEIVGRLIAFVGGLAWSLATFFVVPVLALEGRGAFASVRRSASVFRQRWGEAVTGDVAIGSVGFVASLPGAITLVVGAVTFAEGDFGLGTVLSAGGLLLTVPIWTLSSALTQMFQLAVYRDTVSGVAHPAFTSDDLASAVKPKRRWWRR
jgi:hypothetical protein